MQERRQNGISRQRDNKGQRTRGKAKQPVKTILQLAAEARALATCADWQKLPADLSKRFDEYHYNRSQDQD